MKKFLLILFAVCGLLVSCGNFSDKSEVSSTHIPSHVSHIEFWNGGTMIREYDNANVRFTIANTKHVPPSFVKENTHVTFYTYIIKCNGVEESIIDSESLSIVYRE